MRELLVIAAAACAAVGAKIGIDRLRRSSRAESTIADLRRRGHHLAGQAKGVAYHTLRRHPDANVDDATLVARVKSRAHLCQTAEARYGRISWRGTLLPAAGVGCDVTAGPAAAGRRAVAQCRRNMPRSSRTRRHRWPSPLGRGLTSGGPGASSTGAHLRHSRRFTLWRPRCGAELARHRAGGGSQRRHHGRIERPLVN